MKLIRSITLSFVATGLMLMMSCSGSGGFTLSRSDQYTDMSECLALLKKKKSDKAIKCFESYKSRNVGSSSAAVADLAIADAYFAKKDFLVAAEAYQVFIESYQHHESLPYAYYRAGLSYLRESPNAIDRDQNYLDSAVQYLGIVVKYYSNSSYYQMASESYDEARLKLAQRHFYIGRFYFRGKEFLAAIPRFQTIVTDFPKLGLDEQSFYYLITALAKTDQKDIASQYLEIFKTHYPESKFIKRTASAL